MSAAKPRSLTGLGLFFFRVIAYVWAMQPWITSSTFTVEQPQAWPTKPAVSPWTNVVGAATPEVQPYQTDEKLKKAFGVELAKSSNTFEAACKIFGEDTNKALWVSCNWITDPVVIASRDIYLKNIELAQAPLDREQLAAKVLKLAEGEHIERNGLKLPTIEAKDRIAAFKLYSDILGYTGKVEIDQSTNNNITNNEMIIKLVKAETKPAKIIDNTPNVKSEMPNDTSIISLKLVKAS